MTEPADQDTKDLLNKIIEKLNCIEELLEILLKKKTSSKADRLTTEVMRRGKMDTREVMEFLKVGRKTALDYMMQVAMSWEFKMIDDKKKFRTNSILMYSESLAIKERHARIKKVLEMQGRVTFKELMNELWLDSYNVKEFVKTYLELNKDCIVEGNVLKKLNWSSSHKNNLFSSK